MVGQMTGSDRQVSEFDVRVEAESGGWVVVGDVDGQRKQFGEPHASKEDADKFATQMLDASDRWTGAAEVVEPDP